jgi:hypothetical protein
MSTYPVSFDVFTDRVNGHGPDSLIDAPLVTAAQQAALALERETQYTVTTLNTSGSLLYVARKYVKVKEDQADPGWRIATTLTLPQEDMVRYFGGRPFANTVGILASAVAWGKRSGGQTVYFPVRAAVNTLSNNNDYNLSVVLVKYNKWLAGDQAEVTVTLLRP